MNITETVKSFLREYKLDKKKLLVAFSGGYDSLCLLDILHKLGLNPIAIHLNHNWRGEESLRDENFCCEYCKSRGIEFYTEKLSADIPHTETAAREARYNFFEKCAAKFNSNAVLTAHNLDDLAETMIYRIIKGTGVVGLKGISKQRGNFYRPLLDVSRSEIEAYCKENNLTGVNDSSNNDIKYKRNFIRHKLLPLIAEINENYPQALKSLSEIADETSGIINEFMERIKEETENSTQKFVKLGKHAQNYFIHDYFKRNNLEYDRRKITDVVDFINQNANSKSGRKASVTKDLWIFASEKKFEFITSKPVSAEAMQIKDVGSYEFGTYEFSIEKADSLPEKFPPDKDMTAFVTLKEIDFTLRTRKEGDYICQLGTKGSQTLKKYLNEKKIPNHEKDSVVLLCRDNEILWAAGYGISEKIKVVNKPTHVIKLSKKEGCDYEG